MITEFARLSIPACASWRSSCASETRSAGSESETISRRQGSEPKVDRASESGRSRRCTIRFNFPVTFGSRTNVSVFPGLFQRRQLETHGFAVVADEQFIAGQSR